jgi:hypothetical protein
MALAELLKDKYQLTEGYLRLLDNVLNHFHKHGGEHEAYNLEDLQKFAFSLEVNENANLSNYGDFYLAP